MKRITQFILCIVLAVSAYGQGVGGNSVPRTVSGISAALDLISSTQGTIFYRGASGWEALPPGTSGQLFSTQGAAANPIWVTATGGAGDMNGPASATDNAIVRFDGTGGKTVQNSAVTIADTTGAMTWATGQAATLTGGSSGASLVLESGTTGVATIAAAAGGLRGLVIGAASSSDGFPLRLLLDSNGAATIDHTNANAGASALARFSLVSSAGTSSLAAYSAAHSVWPGSTLLTAPGAGGLSILATSAGGPIDFYTNSSQAARITSTRNLLIGTTTDMASTAGGLTVAATGSGATATAVNTGGLQSANFGLSTVSGGPSYFGGAVNASGAFSVSASGQANAKAVVTNTDTASYSHLDLSSSSGQNSALYQFGSTYATAGRYVQGSMMLEAGGSGGLNLATSAATPIRFYTNGDNVRLAIASDGAATFAGAVSVSGTTATWTSGTGSPESVKTAPVGSLYTRTDGGASTTLYVKESGAGNTGWVAK